MHVADIMNVLLLLLLNLYTCTCNDVHVRCTCTCFEEQRVKNIGYCTIEYQIFIQLCNVSSWYTCTVYAACIRISLLKLDIDPRTLILKTRVKKNPRLPQWRRASPRWLRVSLVKQETYHRKTP